MLRIFAAALLVFSTLAQAAPQKLVAVYHATRNGQPFANVTETFQQENGHYKLESLTEGVGVYALFGKRRLSSEGEVTAEGLRPSHFEQQQGDKKPVTADFDWPTGTLNMQSKGKASTARLEHGTQDLLSFAYQFMFFPPQGDEVVLPVTTGRKLRVYRYKVAERDVALDTGAGKFKAHRLVNAEQGGEEKELWLGVEAQHIPVRIILKDENGARIEQTLTSLHVE
jgi:curved DNA-binding protein CbpA